MNLTRSLALELTPTRVNVVLPGAVHTPLWDVIGDPEMRRQVVKSWEAQNLTGHIGRVEDVADAYLYCFRDRCVTGTCAETNGASRFTRLRGVFDLVWSYRQRLSKLCSCIKRIISRLKGHL